MPEVSGLFDVKVKTGQTVTRRYDTAIFTPSHNTRFTDMTITLGSNTLSDTYQLQTVRNVADPIIDDVFTGRILDYNYRFKAESISRAGARVSVQGRYDNDQLLYTNYEYQLDGDEKLGYHNDYVIFNASSYFKAIANNLGLTPRFYCRDWAVKGGSLPRNCTYGQFLSGLFGWRGSLPQININVFIRGNELYAVERGNEYAVIQAGKGRRVVIRDGYEVKRVPSVSMTKIRTEWTGTVTPPGMSGNDITDDTQEPFTGTIQFGDAALVYENGLLMTRTEGSKTTTYQYKQYDNQDYLWIEEMLDTDAETANKTVYDYVTNNGVLYLAVEDRFTGGTIINGVANYDDAVEVVTTHSPLGVAGQYGLTTINKDTGDVTTSLTQGGAANAANKYMVDKAQEALTGFYSDAGNYLDHILATLLGQPIIDVEFPVDTAFGISSIRMLAQETDWLNGKTEERINTEVVGLNHIVDFTDIIEYNNKDYCLEGNTVHVSGGVVKQALQLVRWHDGYDSKPRA